MLDVDCIFNSIDGEANGFFGAGQPSTFIRLRGCNLRCTYCDTVYAQGSGGTAREVQDIVKRSDLLDKITITGGEPLLQPECVTLIWALLFAGKKVSVETNGSMIPPAQMLAHILAEDNLRFIVDYKLPSSGMQSEMHPEAFANLSDTDVIKFVVADMKDYHIARGIIHENPEWKAIKVFSPAIENQKDYSSWPQYLAKQIVHDADTLGEIHYSLQIHKVLWPYSAVER